MGKNQTYKAQRDQEIIDRFHEYSKSKILIYGTGVRAERIIGALKDFCIVGVLHNASFSGEFRGIPVIPWNEINRGMADVLIVAALPKNYETIYRRIQDKCRTNQIKVLGAAGESLDAYFSNDVNRLRLLEYCKKNGDELKKKIDGCDAVSFDIFDTLVMRKVLEAWDVFELVEVRILEKDIVIKDFKKHRREADKASQGGNIYQIYDILQKRLKLTDAQKEVILKEEVECEKEVLVPRQDLVDIMNYAYQKGKRVSLISNMYLPEEMYREILAGLGIDQYHKLYVSCDYGTTKNEKLFEVYRRDVALEKCLHIGDDSYADIKKPLEHGMEPYGILSAFDMLKISDFHGILGHINNVNEKSLVGLLISYIFNSPFALKETFGIINMRMYRDVGRCFFAPLGILYIQEIFRYIAEHPVYDGVLFAARDGFLFYRMYERYRKEHGDGADCPPAFYFLTSRKAALRTSIQSEEKMEYLKTFLDRISADLLLRNVLGMERVDDKKSCETDLDYIEAYKNGIFDHCKEEEKKYAAYMKKSGILLDKKYLFCEVESRGTTQYALDHLFARKLDGFYMSRSDDSISSISVYSIFDQKRDGKELNAIVQKQYFQEMFLSNEAPSIQGFDTDGNPVYDADSRLQDEVDALEQVMKGAYDFFEEYMDVFYLAGQGICRELVEKLYGFFDKVLYKGECKEINSYCVYDNLLEGAYVALTNRHRQ